MAIDSDSSLGNNVRFNPDGFEEYNQGVLDLLEALDVCAYVTVGSMYDSVPHSRPLIISGSARGWEKPPGLGGITLARSNYEGPMSMTGQISQMASARGIPTLSVMVLLPLYLQLDNDFSGGARVIEALSPIYGLGDAAPERDLGKQQYERVTPAMLKDLQLAESVHRIELEYDSKPAEEAPCKVELSSEIESFLEELHRRTNGENPTT